MSKENSMIAGDTGTHPSSPNYVAPVEKNVEHDPDAFDQDESEEFFIESISTEELIKELMTRLSNRSYVTMNDTMKIEWLITNIDNVTLEKMEALV